MLLLPHATLHPPTSCLPPDRVLERGERIELLVHQTEELRNHAQMFQKQGRALRSNMWWQNMRIKLIVVLVVLLLVVVIFLLACFAGEETKTAVICCESPHQVLNQAQQSAG